jgi:ATP/maltotriose-dependent transcriptional regulator MalT/two-component SAPR family response regulator
MWSKHKMSLTDVEFATRILIPKKGNTVITRPRLLDLLHEHINLSTHVISAPTGYGKTTLLVDFACDLDVPVCWFSLDASCQDPRILLDGVLASLRSNFPHVGRLTESLSPVNRGIEKNISQVISTLTGEIYTSITDYFILILDDFHSIEDSDQSKLLMNHFIEHIPENCHLIISSRSNVGLPSLSSLVMRQRIANITSSQLAFTSEEVIELLTTYYNTDLSPDEADKIVSATEGWILGILLSAQSLKSDLPDGSLLTLSRRGIFSFLTSEVYEKQPSDIQNFLLDTSTLDELESEICKRFLNITDCRKKLHYIEEHNLFLHCFDVNKSWYRYSGFFREFLQNKFFNENPDRFALLHHKLGLIYKDNKQWNKAINHLLIAREFVEVKKIIKVIGEDYQRSGKWSIVADWINALPVDTYKRDPSLLLLHAKSLIYIGQVDKAIKNLTKLILILSDNEDYENQAQALSWRSAAFRLSGLFNKAKIDIEAAINLLENNGGMPDDLAEVHRRLGDIFKEMGQFARAIKHMKKALEYFSSTFNVGSLAETHNSIGIIYKRLGDYMKAETHFEHARQGWLKINNVSSLAATLNNIGNVYQHWGQHELALDTFRLGLEKTRETGYKRIEASLLINMAEAFRDLGQYDDALKTYNEGLDLARQVMEMYYVMWAKAGIGETYQHVNEYDKAIIYLNEAIGLAKENQQIYEAIFFTMKLGVVEYNQGKYEAAIKTLNDVYNRITKLRDKDTLARVSLHLAQASFLARNYDQAINWLKKSSELASELKYDDFFVTEGEKAVLLFQYGISNDVYADRFLRVIEKIRERYEKKRGYKVVKSPPNSYVEPEPQLIAYALGGTCVELDRSLISDSDWRSNRAKEIFFYLLFCNNGQTKEHIVTTFWPDLSPARSSSNFHINLYRARRAVFPGVFTLEQGRYKLNPLVKVWFDVIEFKKLIDKADGIPRGSKIWANYLEQAIKLYKGSFMPDFYSEWVEVERRELENKYLKILPTLARYKGERKEYNDAISLLEKFIGIDPYHEEIYCQLIEWYLATRDKISALRVYKQYLDIVTTDLNIKPSARLDKVYKDILMYKSG